MSEATNPNGESGPRTDWDIGKAMNVFFEPEAVAVADPELEADEAPDEDKADTDEVDEVEASGDEDADSEDEETSDDEFTPLPLKVGGKEVVVESKEEAIALAQKGMHYTQEMQKLREREAQLASEHEQHRAKLDQTLGQYEKALSTLNETFGYVMGEPPDWSSAELQRMKAESPADYVALREQWDQLGTIRSELQRVAREKQEKEQKQFQTWVAQQQQDILAKRPEWNDATRRQQDFKLISDYAVSQGITEQEIGNLYDARFWTVLLDAARYRQAETAGKKKVAVASKTVAPGSGKNVNQGNRQFRATRDALKQTGDVHAAGAIFQELMTRKK